MKNFILSAVASFGMVMGCIGQVPSNYNADNESRGRQPLGQFLFQNYNRKNIDTRPEIEGSPFLSEDFVRTKIYSEGGLETEIFSRYDGYNEELQLKKYPEDPKVSILLKRVDIYAETTSSTIVCRTFYDKREKFQRGHLFELMKTEYLTVFERKRKRYKDGKEALNSFQMSVKDRFVAESELYYAIKGQKDVHFLKTTKKAVMTLFKETPEKANAIREYMSTNKIDLKEPKQLLQVLRYYETL